MSAPATTDRRGWYLSLHEEFERSMGGAAGALRPLRRQALERFARLGFPTTRDEQWRYTSVAPLARTNFGPAAEAAATRVELAALETFSFPGLDCSRLVFVDGHWSPELSAVRALPPPESASPAWPLPWRSPPSWCAAIWSAARRTRPSPV